MDESDFDDAIIDIANEIAQINAMNAAATSPKSDPQIAIKVDMELKKVESSSTNLFRILKTLQEVQVYSGERPAVSQGLPSTIERKYIPHSKGSDKKYHPLTITETIVTSKKEEDYQTLTIEDLFEDSDPEEKPSVIASPKKNPLIAGPIIAVSNRHSHNAQSGNVMSGNMAIKTVNIPNTLTKSITWQLKDSQRDILKSFLKMQRR